MLEALGFEIEFTALLPESALGRRDSAGSAYYTYGGRGTVAYLFAGVSIPRRMTYRSAAIFKHRGRLTV